MPKSREAVPRVFVSSTQDDLTSYRAVAKDACVRVGFMPVMSEHWSASGARTPLAHCLEAVADCDLLIVLVAHRYGWVPDATAEAKSITWLECEEAARRGREVLAFMLNGEARWPSESREEYRLAAAARDGSATPALIDEVTRNLARLADFRAWLDGLGIRATFTSENELLGEVLAALNDWRIRHRVADGEGPLPEDAAPDPTRALRSVFEQSRFIDIRGLQVGSGKAHQFPIDELFIPMHAAGTVGSAGGGSSLEDVLAHRCVAIVGDPGCGKTTFIRRIASIVAGVRLGVLPRERLDALGLDGEPPLPLFARLSDFGGFVERDRSDDRPTTANSPEWLVRFLAAVALEHAWGLDDAFFRDVLQSGQAIVLLDGLDEAASEATRRKLSRIVETAARTYDSCHFVLTSRPKAYQGEAILDDFAKADVAPLSDGAIATFLTHWCAALFPDSPDTAAEHRRELDRALDRRPEIKRMATNPVMLTALAVVHWNEKRLPEQRAELYESIVTWLSRARQDRSGRPSPEQCVAQLQTVALGMQTDPEGRQIQWARHRAAECIAKATGSGGLAELDAAERFLREEELDSGIIVGRGDEVRFWHLSFQEFLAARAIASAVESEQKRIVLDDRETLLSSEWRETVLLLAGVLNRQGRQKTDAMIEAIVRHRSAYASLQDKARTVGLVGAIQRDLLPTGYAPTSRRYKALVDEVAAILDGSDSENIDVATRLEAADALGQIGDPRAAAEPWVSLSGGVFCLGLQWEDPGAHGYDPGALATETPVQSVRLESFLIGRFPVTVSEFQEFIADNGYGDRKHWRRGGFGTWKQPDQWENQVRFPSNPVAGISWYEAAAYCAWKGFGTRLPAEAEWERAARGAEGRRYPWGDERPDEAHLNFSDCKLGRVTPVGFYPHGASPEGIHDLSGNMFEWCADRFAHRMEQGPQSRRDPGEVQAHLQRAVRGGGFASAAHFVRAGFRGRFAADYRAADVGFRLCRSAPAAEESAAGPTLVS
jgi:formylglycine-generating enzyme required for sulfatase activity